MIFMMWFEAVLASMLLVTAMLLLSQPPPQSAVLTENLATWQLEDRLAVMAELGSDHGLEGAADAGVTMSDTDLRSVVFNQSEPFCYAWAWLNESNGFSNSAPDFSYSEDDCASYFDANPPALRSLRRGVWRAGSLQFLLLEQAPKD